jgi:MoxR-like ATPase
MTATESDYEAAVAQHAPARSSTIADELDLSEGHAQKRLKTLAVDRSDVQITREQDGNGYVYLVGEPEPADTATGETAAEAGEHPAVRDYELSGMAVERPNEYFSSSGELKKLTARVETREATGQPVRALIDGHTGTGKTTLAENVAAQHGAAFFEVSMRDDMSDSDLFGSPVLAGDATVWSDGVVTKALMASAPAETQVAEGWVADEADAHEGPVVLLIDELNRAPAKAKNALFAALDHRCRITLDGPRGGEVIEGDALQLIALATINEGPEYHGTHRLDHAEESRWTNRYSCEYLSSYDPDTDTFAGIETEARLLVERNGIPRSVAERMAQVAADIRYRAADDTNTAVEVGIPTRTLIAWAATAVGYDEAGLDDPAVESAQDTVLGFYSGPRQGAARSEVLAVVEDSLKGAPLSEDGMTEFEAAEVVRCDSSTCGWREPKPVAEEQGILAVPECPDCGSDIETVRR